MARTPLASSSTSSSGSAMMSLETGADEHREPAGQQPCLERSRPGDLTVQLHGTRCAFRDLDAYRAAAPPPDAPAFAATLPIAQQQLDHRARALKHAVSVQRHDVEPTIIRSQRGAQREKTGRESAAVQYEEHGGADFVDRPVHGYPVRRAAHRRQGERGARDIGAELPPSLLLESRVRHQLRVEAGTGRHREVMWSVAALHDAKIDGLAARLE